MSLYLMIAVIVICLILEALYSGGEVALFSSDINKIKYYASKGSSAARQAVRLKERRKQNAALLPLLISRLV